MLLFTPNINNADQSILDGVSNNVVLDVDVARSSAAAFVVRHLDCTLIILHDWNRAAPQSRHDELLHMTKELGFIHDFRKNHIILRLG